MGQRRFLVEGAFVLCVLGGGMTAVSTGCTDRDPGPAGAPGGAVERGGTRRPGSDVIPADRLPRGVRVRGVVLFEGEPPPRQKVDMSETAECVHQHNKVFGDVDPLREVLVVGSGGAVRDVFVYLKRGVKGRYSPPSTPAVLDQQGCTFVPHVFKIMTNQDLRILNSDPIIHNVKVMTNRPFNIGMAEDEKEVLKERWFKRPQVPTVFRCDFHPWMDAYACVIEHPFGDVTGDDGRYELKDVPPGSYTIGVWHEKYPGLRFPPDQHIEIREGESDLVVGFSFRIEG